MKEIKQPQGYVLSDSVFEVNISENQQIIEIKIVNKFLKGNIALTKVDKEYPDNKLTGAEFEVWQDSNDNGKIDETDILIGNLEETTVGYYEKTDLFYGKYLVRETKAPEGFVLDNAVYPVFIETGETRTNFWSSSASEIDPCVHSLPSIAHLTNPT